MQNELDRQAKGVDTPIMLVVLLSLAGAANVTLMPWYTRLGSEYQAYLQMYEMAAPAIGIMMIAAAVLTYWKKGKAILFARLLHGAAVVYSVGMIALVLLINHWINEEQGITDTFQSLTKYGSIQLTAYPYAQIFCSGLLILGMRRLLDTAQERATVVRDEQEDDRVSARVKVALGLIVIAIPLLIAFGIWFLNDRSYYFIAVCIVVLSMLPFALVFEGRRPQAREILIIAVLAAFAVAGRAAFFMIPFFKPMSAVIIIAGVSLGAEAGFLTGAMAAFVSNFFFGQGPWTPWQMFAFGILGFLAGLLFGGRRKRQAHRKLWLCLFGGLSTLIIYGVIMDTASVLMYTSRFSIATFLAAYISGFPVNVIHASSTVIFLLLLAEPMIRKLDRIKVKYGLIEP